MGCGIARMDPCQVSLVILQTDGDVALGTGFPRGPAHDLPFRRLDGQRRGQCASMSFSPYMSRSRALTGLTNRSLGRAVSRQVL